MNPELRAHGRAPWGRACVLALSCFLVAACGPQADIIRLLLLTGCRRGEILILRWRGVDGNTLNLADAKTGPRRGFLNGPARGILERRPRDRGGGRAHRCGHRAVIRWL